MTGSAPEAKHPQARQSRLDSWKEIARYLGRDVRTVQRWEQQEGLPVHRHFHRKRGSVYAITAEIDRWRADRTDPPVRNIAARRKIVIAIAAAIVAAISVVGLWHDPDPVGEPPAPDPEAHRQLMIGREFLRTRSSPQQDALRAAEAFERAIAVDPTYAEAYGALALVRATQSAQIMNRVSFTEAVDLANRALEIEPNLVDAHTALGIVSLQTGSIGDAHASLDKALALDPQDVYAGYWLSMLLREQGRYDESDERLLTALNADPLHPLLNTEFANRQWSRGEYERAITHFEKVLQGPDPAADVLFNLSELHREFGDFEQSLYWAKETARVSPRFSGLLALITTYAVLDMPDRADFWFRQLVAAEGNGPPRLGIHSQYLFLSGDIEPAYQLKARYVERAGVPLTRLPFAVRETIGGMAILSGRFDEGIEIMEALFGSEFRIPEHLGGSHFAMTFAQLLAYAYLETGRPLDARRICDEIDARIRSLRAAGNGYSPSFYVLQARNFALLNQQQQALAALRRAIELGWRNYVFERQMPAWQTLQSNPEYLALLEDVTQDVAAQRQRIEATGLDAAGDDLVIALLRQ